MAEIDQTSMIQLWNEGIGTINGPRHNRGEKCDIGRESYKIGCSAYISPAYLNEIAN